MNIWWHTFEPSLTDGNWKTACAGGQWTKALWNTFDEMPGTQVTNVSVGEDTIKCPTLDRASAGGPPPDCIVLVWRWNMPGYPQRCAAWERQNELLDYAYKHEVPVLIHDEDLQWDNGVNDPIDNLVEFKAAGIPMALTMPAFYPPKGYETLHFPYAFRDSVHDVWSPTRVYKRSYIGNNYGRYEQAKEWLARTECDVWGNWMDPHPDRQSPENVKVTFGPKVTFHDRLDQRYVKQVLGRSISTVHLAKPDYCTYGFIALRWAEAAFAGCLAFVPDEYYLPKHWWLAFPSEKGIWRQDWNDISFEERFIYSQRVNEQQLLVAKEMSHFAWVKRISDLIKEKK